MRAFLLMLINSALLIGYIFVMAAPLGLFAAASVAPVLEFLLGLWYPDLPHFVQEPFWYLMLIFAAGIAVVLSLDLLFGILFRFSHRELTPLDDQRYTDVLRGVAAAFRLRDVRLYLDANAGHANAFALSNYRYASVTLTRGMYEILQRDWEQYGPEEWERVTRALIGHECSHISHFDTVPQYMFMLGVQVGNHIYDWFVRIVYLLGRIIIFIPFIGPILGTLLVFLQRLLTELQVGLLYKVLLPLQQLFHRVMSRRQEYRADRNGAQVSSPESMYTLLSFFAQNSDMKGLRLFDSHPPVERRVLRQVRSMERPQEKLTPRSYRKIVMGLMAAGQIAAVGFFGLFAAESAGLVTLGAVAQVEAAGTAIAHTAGIDPALESVIDPDTLFAYLHPQRLWNTAPVQAGIAGWTCFAEFQSSIAAVPRIAADAVLPSVQNAPVRWLRAAAAWCAAIMAQVFVISLLYDLVIHLFWRIEAALRKSRINRSQETPLDFLLEIAVYTGNIRLARFALRHGALFAVDPGEAPGRLSRYLRYYQKN